MSRDITGLAEIDQALDALRMISALRSQGRQAFEDSQERQHSAAYLWIVVGSALKQFCRLRGIGQGSSPFPGPIGMRDRLCYASPRDLSASILWETCDKDTDDLMAVLLDVRSGLMAGERPTA